MTCPSHGGLTVTLNRQQWGLKDASLIRNQGFIDGKWVDAKEGGKFTVTSTCYADTTKSPPFSMSFVV